MGCGVWQQGGASGQANWEDFRRINVFMSRARMQVVLLASSSILMSSLYWRRALGTSPWVRAEVGPGSPGSPDLKSSLSCLRRDDNFIPCVSCCRGTDHALPPWCFSRSVLKKMQATGTTTATSTGTGTATTTVTASHSQSKPRPQPPPPPPPRPQPQHKVLARRSRSCVSSETYLKRGKTNCEQESSLIGGLCP